jgi:nitronate monooxygenase
MPIPAHLQRNLKLPVITAPMFLVSGPDLVIAACKSGVIGTLPALNARTLEQVEQWYQHITTTLDPARDAAWGVNLIVHKTNQQRLQADLDLLVKYKCPLIITSIGNPAPIVEAARTYGGAVFHDVTEVRWAKKAIQGGVDGLILVCGGAGGHAGVMNPFALLPQVREFWNGTIALAGAISDGRAVRAAQVLGADFAYVGTRFIATKESMARPDYKDMIVAADATDIVYTPAFSGIPANMLAPSIAAAGLDPKNLPEKKEINLGAELNAEHKAWRDIWSAGQGVGSIHDNPGIADLVARMQREYDAAKAA